MKPFIIVILLSYQFCFAKEEVLQVDAKTSQILTAVLQDILTGTDNEGAREFYGTKGDTTVILLDGSGIDGQAVKWNRNFHPKIKGFTFIFGHQKQPLGSEHYNRRLAIRLDRLMLKAKEVPKGKKHVFWDKSPIRLSIQNAGGSKNGAVMGGQTTWYSIVKMKTEWSVKFDGAID